MNLIGYGKFHGCNLEILKVEGVSGPLLPLDSLHQALRCEGITGGHAWLPGNRNLKFLCNIHKGRLPPAAIRVCEKYTKMNPFRYRQAIGVVGN